MKHATMQRTPTTHVINFHKLSIFSCYLSAKCEANRADLEIGCCLFIRLCAVMLKMPGLPDDWMTR